MPKERKYGSKKTTTREGKREYMSEYMKDYRAWETERRRAMEKKISEVDPDWFSFFGEKRRRRKG